MREFYSTLVEGARRWLGYTERNVASHQSLALLARKYLICSCLRVWTFGMEDGTYYGTKRNVWTFGTEHTVVLSAETINLDE